MVFNVRSLLTGVLVSLAVVSTLAQTDIQCNDVGTAGDCTQFIPKFCADVASAKVKGYDEVYRCYSASGFTCELTAYNTHDVVGTPSKVNCGKVLNKVSETCPQASLFHA
ncbi:hypothetical protein M413DRAFT_26686 [Hebeloma cylindrosporum]|uniref:Glycan binding protein Y3-like domain-containing protein n=1 Tax=Hebeloma cylindrosporum TaxID=76867 RepID=A0A0C3CGF2_HEBCY|nr:hypothetical protein M413DRAFT_26686 [Hebeloma cylindrosporum h7]